MFRGGWGHPLYLRDMDGLDPAALKFVKHSLKGFLGLTKNAGDYESLIEIVLGSRVPELFEAHGRFAMSDPAVAALARERYEPPLYDTETLRAMPTGSLGYEYAKFLTSRGLSVEDLVRDFDAVPRDTRDVDYLYSRRFRTHDIHHLIANFNTSMAGEIGVAAIYYVQLRNPVGPVMGAAILSHAILEPEWLAPISEAIQHGYRIGRDAKNLFGFKYEEGWERPLEEWRREIGIEPAPEISSFDLERAWHESHPD